MKKRTSFAFVDAPERKKYYKFVAGKLNRGSSLQRAMQTSAREEESRGGWLFHFSGLRKRKKEKKKRKETRSQARNRRVQVFHRAGTTRSRLILFARVTRSCPCLSSEQRRKLHGYKIRNFSARAPRSAFAELRIFSAQCSFMHV